MIDEAMTFESAAQRCRETGLTGWPLVAEAQRLIGKTIRYSVENSLDSPEAALTKGQGYCWHQASALNVILQELGFESRLVHAFKNHFPEVELAGARVQDFISGHVWCRVTLEGEEKDVCPGHRDNTPGVTHFTPMTKVLEWNKGIELLTYYGAALVNAQRKRKYSRVKAKEDKRWVPETCPCRKTDCERYKQCDECKENHYAKGGLPACER